MRVLLVIGLFIHFIPCGIQAQQNAYIDSVNRQLMVPMADTVKVKLLNKIAEDLYYINQDKIEEYALLALELSEEIDYQVGIAHAYNNLGIYYRAKGIYDKAIDYFFNALKIMENEKNEQGIARSYNLIGILYYYLNNYDLSLEYYQKALKLNQEQHDMKWIAGNSNNIGMIYEQKGKYDEAIKYYMKSLEMNISIGNKNWVSNNYGNIGSLYLKTNNPQSLEYFTRKLEINKELGNETGISLSEYLIGSYYVKYHDFVKAVHYLSEAYKISYSKKSLGKLKNITGLLSAAYDSLQIYDSAFLFQKKFKAYSDTLKLNESTKKITRLRLQYQYNKQAKVNEINYEKAKFRQSLSAIGLVFLLIIFIFLYSKKKSTVKEQKLKQEQFELDNLALQEELNYKEKILKANVNYLLKKNELIACVLVELKQVKQKCKQENKTLLEEIIRDLNVGMQTKTWNEFELWFNQIHGDFHTKLNQKFPALTPNEKKLCAFLKLNMSTKEIAALTQHSVNSIETARSRLRKKLQIQNSSQSINSFLNQL